MPGITISAGYGAGGSIVAPAVAAALGWTFVDRAITVRVAQRLEMPVKDVETGGPTGSWLSRFVLSLAPLGEMPVDDEPVLAADEEVRLAMEQELRETVRSGAVVLGRAGSCALLNEPGVMRVRLYGPVAARVAAAARAEGLDERTAAARRRSVDAARDAYVRRLYRRRADDPALYHLQINSTEVPLAACTEVITQAWRAVHAGS